MNIYLYTFIFKNAMMLFFC